MNGLFHIRFYYTYVKEQQELWRGDEAGLEVNYDSRTEWVLRKLYTAQTAVKQLVAPSCNGDAVIKTKSMFSWKHKRNCLTRLQGRRRKKRSKLTANPAQLCYRFQRKIDVILCKYIGSSLKFSLCRKATQFKLTVHSLREFRPSFLAGLI